MLQFKHFSSILGFSSLGDFLATALGLKGFGFVVLQVSIAGMAGFLAFVENWIYYPSSSIFIMVGLIFSDCLLGVVHSKKVEKRWDRSHLNRFVPLMLTRIFLMSVGFHLKQADPDSFSWVPETIFAYFSAQHAMAILEHMVGLKLVKPRLLQFFASRFGGGLPKNSTHPKKEDNA